MRGENSFARRATRSLLFMKDLNNPQEMTFLKKGNLKKDDFPLIILYLEVSVEADDISKEP